jgi:hypothetical protein
LLVFIGPSMSRRRRGALFCLLFATVNWTLLYLYCVLRLPLPL